MLIIQMRGLSPYYREHEPVTRATQQEVALVGFNPDSLTPESPLSHRGSIVLAIRYSTVFAIRLSWP